AGLLDRRGDLARAAAPLPRSDALACAVRVGMAAQIGCGEIGPDGAGVFGRTAAVARVAREDGASFVPEHFAFSLCDELLDARRGGVELDALTVGSGAEVEAFARVTSAKVECVAARGDGHGFERF